MILASGVFDGLHPGHVRYLTQALAWKRHGQERLVVAVAPDAYVRAAKHREPTWTETERMALVAAVRGVHHVVLHGPGGVEDQILALSPRVFLKGSDWDGHLPDHVLEACAAVRASVIYIPASGKHTSEVRSA